MHCHAPSEDAEDDDMEFLAAAQDDATLVANLLIRLSRSETYAPWRPLREPPSPPASPSTGEEDALVVLPDPPKWGKRRARSRCLTTEGTLSAKREEARRASPTTPLSWSGGSWTSGSVCESTPPPPPKRRKQPDAAPRHDVEPALMSPLAKREKPERFESSGPGQGPASVCKWRKVEAAGKDGEPHMVFAAGEPAAVGSSSGYGSSKGIVAGAVGGPPRKITHVEPLRLRSTGESTNSVVVRRPGKKKTAPELKALQVSLLQEQVELRKELEEQKKIYAALLEENIKLNKNLESSSASHTVGEPAVTQAVREEAGSEEPRRTQTMGGQSTAADCPEQHQCRSLSTSAPQPAPLFDLNCPPDGDLF